MLILLVQFGEMWLGDAPILIAGVVLVDAWAATEPATSVVAVRIGATINAAQVCIATRCDTTHACWKNMVDLRSARVIDIGPAVFRDNPANDRRRQHRYGFAHRRRRLVRVDSLLQCHVCRPRPWCWPMERTL